MAFRGGPQGTDSKKKGPGDGDDRGPGSLPPLPGGNERRPPTDDTQGPRQVPVNFPYGIVPVPDPSADQRRAHVLGPEAQADKPRRNVLQQRTPADEPNRPRWNRLLENR